MWSDCSPDIAFYGLIGGGEEGNREDVGKGGEAMGLIGRGRRGG